MYETRMVIANFSTILHPFLHYLTYSVKFNLHQFAKNA